MKLNRERTQFFQKPRSIGAAPGIFVILTAGLWPERTGRMLRSGIQAWSDSETSRRRTEQSRANSMSGSREAVYSARVYRAA
jgi:hypothetical protein